MRCHFCRRQLPAVKAMWAMHPKSKTRAVPCCRDCSDGLTYTPCSVCTRKKPHGEDDQCGYERR